MAVTALEIKTSSPFAQGIAFGDVIFRIVDGRDKNDRCVLGPGALANHGGGFAAVHDGH